MALKARFEYQQGPEPVSYNDRCGNIGMLGSDCARGSLSLADLGMVEIVGREGEREIGLEARFLDLLELGTW